MNNILRDFGLVLFMLTICLIQSCNKEANKDAEPITYGTITDIDGNAYKTIQIEISSGMSKSLNSPQTITQTWMAENLKTTKYNNGDAIPNVTQNQEWVALTSGAYCSYNNDANNSKKYGLIYNWYAVNTGNLCPAGWHVPSEPEWTTLITSLGGESIAGAKLKEAGFTAHPGGTRVWDGSFNLLGISSNRLSSSEQDKSTAWCSVMSSSSSINMGNFDKNDGMSVRCLMGEAPKLLVLTTTAPTSISQVSAISGGNIVSDNGASDVIVRGVCWNNWPDPVRDPKFNTTADGNGTGSFTSNLTNLSPNTTYYVRAYATNMGGTAYGNQISFTTLPVGLPIIFNPGLTYGSLSDIDGNVYKTIKIGTQVWMAENLKTTSLNDNTAINNLTTSWTNINSPSYCWYNNDPDRFKDSFGAFYNGYAVRTDKLCPTGWHVPSNDDWTILISYLGGMAVAGDKLRETGNSHWWATNPGVANTNGFTALPCGSHYNDTHSYFGNTSYWWSSTPGDFSSLNMCISIYYLSSDVVISSSSMDNGYSVRCIKDN
jgi:uncharacterized protein (TIGR02145 family)